MDRFPSLALALCFVASSCNSMAPRPQSAPVQNELQRPVAPGNNSLPTPYIPDPNAALPQIQLGAASHDPAPRVDRHTALSADSPWIRAAGSAQHREMLVASVGAGAETVLVVGNLAGDDPHTPQAMDRLIRQLSGRNAVPGVRVALIRSPNPDGLAAGTRGNSRGVDLNGNFPQSTANTSRLTAAGDEPASEPETNFLLRSLSQLRPNRILQLESRDVTDVEVEAYSVDHGVREICAAHRAKLTEPAANELASGSLAEFAVVRTKTPVIRVALPKELRPDDIKLLLDLIGRPRAAGAAAPPPPQESIPAGVPIAEEEQPGRSGARLTGSLQSESDGQAGFVEFLPTPPHFADSADGDPLYQELTPAP